MSMVAAGVGAELLKRDEALSRLVERFAGVRAESSGGIVWVGGEAGVGKTARLRRFCQMQDTDSRVVWGACEPLRTPRPLGPFSDVAEEIGGEVAELVAAAARPYEVVAALLPRVRLVDPQGSYTPSTRVAEHVKAGLGERPCSPPSRPRRSATGRTTCSTATASLPVGCCAVRRLSPKPRLL
jgi:hypothetical protein